MNRKTCRSSGRRAARTPRRRPPGPAHQLPGLGVGGVDLGVGLARAGARVPRCDRPRPVGRSRSRLGTGGSTRPGVGGMHLAGPHLAGPRLVGPPLGPAAARADQSQRRRGDGQPVHQLEQPARARSARDSGRLHLRGCCHRVPPSDRPARPTRPDVKCVLTVACVLVVASRELTRIMHIRCHRSERFTHERSVVKSDGRNR